MEPTIYKPTIYNAPTIYNMGGNGGGGGVGNVVNIGGRNYPYIKLNDKLWITENLVYIWPGLENNYTDTNSEIPRYCYRSNDPDQAALYKIGPYYNWGAIKYLDANSNDLLPSGWHIPSKAEFDNLFSFIGVSEAAKRLKAQDNSVLSNWPSGYNGLDSYGFFILPTGIAYIDNGSHFGKRCDLWIKPEHTYLETYMFRYNYQTVDYNTPDRGYFTIRLCCNA